MTCIARLTNWDKTSFRIDACFTVSHIVLCKHKALANENLCKNCMVRPTESKYHTRMIHGLLTEPIPDTSSLYGGPVYWQKMKKFEEAGKKLSEEALEWIAKAQAAQEKAEMIQGAWKVQRPSTRDILDMKKKKIVPKEKPALPKYFKPVEVKYVESDTPPVKMETDSMKVSQYTLGDDAVWIAENGMVFRDTGDIGEFMGMYLNDEFIEA